MFQALKFGARDELAYLAAEIGPQAYQDHIWALRYPEPAIESPLGSAIWVDGMKLSIMRPYVDRSISPYSRRRINHAAGGISPFE